MGSLLKTVVALCVILAIVAVVQWRAASRERAAELLYPPEGDILDIGGVAVHVVTMGAGPDLVLLHGASGNTRDMTFGFAQELAENYRVIIFDRPALGWTGHVAPQFSRIWPRRAESPFEQAALLQKAARQIGVSNPIVMGQSYGGAVGWAWALTAPDDTAALVSVAGVANPWPGTLSFLHRANSTVAGAAFLVPLLTAFAPQATVKDTLASIYAPQSPPDGYLEHVGAGLTLRRKTLRGNARQVTSLRPHIVDISNRYHELRMPVEIVHGDADTIVPLDVHSITLPDQIKGANLTILKGAGHMPHHTHRSDVIAAIDRAASRAGLR